MNKRDNLLKLINDTAPSNYVPAAFFMHFDPAYHEGQPAIDKHLEFFHATGMDFVKIQYEQELPSSIPITKPEDWANVPPCYPDFFEPTLHIVRELVKAAKGHTLYILDEPTTGLHLSDVQNLLQVLQTLVDQGNTVAVIEHNIEIIKAADYIIDLGPEGGDGGGRIVVSGSPDELLACPNGSHTACFLAKYLAN